MTDTTNPTILSELNAPGPDEQGEPAGTWPPERWGPERTGYNAGDFDLADDSYDEDHDDESWLAPVTETVRANPVGTALTVAGIALLLAPSVDRSTVRKQYRRARDAGSAQMSHYRSKAAHYRSKADNYTSALRDRISEGTHDMSDAARERVIAARKRALASASETGDYLRHGQERAQTAMQDNPLMAGALALAAGAALGAALPRTRMEDSRFGAMSERLMDEARAVYEKERAMITAGARAATDEMREMATEAVQDTRDALPDGEEAVERVKMTARDGAKRVSDAAREGAENS